VWLAIFVAGYALQVIWRLYLAMHVVGPVIHDDEDGYLLAARVLAGGPGATLPSWSIMRPMGYPLLLAPIYLVVQTPIRVYAAVHVVNALIMATSFPLLYLLGRRLFDTGRAFTAAVAFVLAALPSLVFFGEFALTEVVLAEMLLMLLLAVHSMLTGRHPAVAGAAAGLIAGYAANTHVRGLVMLVVLAGLVLIAVWRRWIGRATAIATAAAAAVAYLAGYLVNRWLEGQLFPGPGAFTPDSRVFDRLTTLSGLFRVLADGFGQIWYLCTSTYGLAALGLAAAIMALARRETALATRIVLGSALVMNLGIAFATAAGIPDENRVNNHIYGRYVSLFAGLWCLVAIIALSRASVRRAAELVAAATAIEWGTLGLVWLHAHQLMAHEEFNSFDAAELSFLSRDYRHLHLVAMTELSIVLMLAWAAGLTGWRALRSPHAAVYGRRIAIAALTALLLLNLAATSSMTHSIAFYSSRVQYQPGPDELVRDARVQPGSSIAEASNIPWAINQRHQREVYWAPLPSFNPDGAPPGYPTYAVALAGWPGARYGYTIDHIYPDAAHVTWIVWQHG
jgi:hypothetical protein